MNFGNNNNKQKNETNDLKTKYNGSWLAFHPFLKKRLRNVDTLTHQRYVIFVTMT